MPNNVPKRNFRRTLSIRFFQFLFRYSTNSPYISGDSVAKCCDYYAYGRFSNRKINLVKLSKAASIFVPGHLLFDFLAIYESEINAKTIVSGNSDHNFTQVPQLPKSVSLFLCQNLEFTEDRRAHTLPIGLENLRLGRSGRRRYHEFQTSFLVTDRILVPPMSPTNPIRAKVLQDAKTLPELFDVQDDYMVEEKYFFLTKKYKFILALEGNGYENHRIWEALYQGSFPVMLNSNWSRSLREYRLPILFVDDILDVSSELLSEFNSQFESFDPKDLDILWTDFWCKAIRSGSFPD